jgi:hypothetical protein
MANGKWQMANQAKLISAKITSTTPKNIPVRIAASENKTAISPLLSNPKDSITIATITSGPRPAFEVRAHIVGINEVDFEDNTVQRTNYWKLLGSKATSTVSYSCTSSSRQLLSLTGN